MRYAKRLRKFTVADSLADSTQAYLGRNFKKVSLLNQLKDTYMYVLYM